jgi:uncharacterized protein YdhG (YjbR/CyaY superfamily)
MAKNKVKSIEPGGVDEYITKFPKEEQASLAEIRAAIREVAPDAIETVSYFQIPGYSLKGYDYNGMFAWFSYKEPYVRLHVRPPVIDDHKEDLSEYSTTTAIVSFPANRAIPTELVKKLVKASLKIMMDKKS